MLYSEVVMSVSTTEVTMVGVTTRVAGVAVLLLVLRPAAAQRQVRLASRAGLVQCLITHNFTESNGIDEYMHIPPITCA